MSSRFNQLWFTRNCNRLSKRMKRLNNRAKRKNMSTDWKRYNTAFKEYKKECNIAHNKYLNDNVFQWWTKKFYTYVKSKRQDVSVSTLKVNRRFIIDDCQKANALNDQYCSVFSTPGDITPPINTPVVKEPMPDIVVSPEGVQVLLSWIKPTKATGPDDITSHFQEFSKEITPALKLIFFTSLHSEELTQDWLHTRVSPVYKGGNKNRSSPESYRPILLTSICWKTFKHIVYSNIMKHFNQHKVIDDVQHGFRKKRSCCYRDHSNSSSW